MLPAWFQNLYSLILSPPMPMYISYRALTMSTFVGPLFEVTSEIRRSSSRAPKLKSQNYRSQRHRLVEGDEEASGQRHPVGEDYREVESDNAQKHPL